MSFSRSSLDNFFIYNTNYGQKEGQEDEKIMLFIPQEEKPDNKNKAVGLCQALVQFTQSFNPSKPFECLVTQKTKQYFLNPEGQYWMVMTLRISSNERFVKEQNVTEYYSDDLQDSICQSVLQQSYDMFVLFNGPFSMIVDNHNLSALKERLEFFYTRYLQTLNFGLLDLLDVYNGVSYLPLDKSEFLKVHCFSNLLENTFDSVKHVCVLQNDLLLWTTLTQKDMKILYKYLTTSLFPASVEDNENNSKNSSSSLSQNSHVYNANFPNPGKFFTAPIEMVSPSNAIPKRAPRIFIDVHNEVKELNLLVYKAVDTIICLMVDLQTLTSDFCLKFHNFVGPQLGNLSNAITEQILKRNSVNNDPQYRYIYFNTMNLAIKTSIHIKRTGITSVSPEVMKLLVDAHHDFDILERSVCETIVNTSTDCWIVGRRSNSREFFVIFNQKNAGLADIDEEIDKFVNRSFNNMLLFLT